jgi:hypothetical protein
VIAGFLLITGKLDLIPIGAPVVPAGLVPPAGLRPLR